MIWNFNPEKEFQHLSVSGNLSWSESEAEVEITVLGADPMYPLRVYGIQGEERYYLGLMIPEKEVMNLKIKRACPRFEKLFICIGRIEEEYTTVAWGEHPQNNNIQLPIEDAPKKKRKGGVLLETLPWEKKTEPEKESDSQRFLFAHPSTRANLKFYGHYCKINWNEEQLYAFASSFGPHPLPHLAKYSCWYDVDLSFGYRGYFLIGLRQEEFFLPEILDNEAENVI